MLLTNQDPQCLIDDGKGNLFLCPADKRTEAELYFTSTYAQMADPIYNPSPLPKFLQEISGIENLTFYSATVE